MQGVVIDEKGRTIEAAIVKIIKAQKSEKGIEDETVTYTRTDENGRFHISDLGTNEEYIIEIHLEKPESEVKSSDSAYDHKEDNMITDTVSIDNPISVPPANLLSNLSTRVNRSNINSFLSIGMPIPLSFT
jgi:phosphoenolpyruvate synthase/pyruvate phosphate dikinase